MSDHAALPPPRASLLATLLDALPADLHGAAARTAWAGLEHALPRLPHVGAEIHLGASTPRVDVLFAVTRDHQQPALLARWLEAGPSRPWARPLAQFIRQWGGGGAPAISQCWLEFDARPTGEGVPSVFFSLAEAPGKPARIGADLAPALAPFGGGLADQLAELLQRIEGIAPPAASANPARRAPADGPGHGPGHGPGDRPGDGPGATAGERTARGRATTNGPVALTDVAVMTGRPGAPLRVNLGLGSPRDAERSLDYLTAGRWPADLFDAAPGLRDLSARTVATLDWPPGADANRGGLELHPVESGPVSAAPAGATAPRVKTPQAANARGGTRDAHTSRTEHASANEAAWHALLTAVATPCAIPPAARAALLRWPGLLLPDAAWPDDLWLESLRAGPGTLLGLERVLSHVKLAIDDSRRLVARAYVGVRPVRTSPVPPCLP